MSLPKGWSRISEYAIRKAPWIVAKVFVDGHTLYVLSSDANGGTRYGNFESAAEAISYSEAMELGAQA
jgi:hypothetical protein